MAGEDPEIDPAAEYLWQWFWSAHLGRQSGMAAWQPLPAAEWTAWQQMHGHIIHPMEWEILREMDTAFLEAVAQKNGTDGKPEKASAELTADLFDAVFG